MEDGQPLHEPHVTLHPTASQLLRMAARTARAEPMRVLLPAVIVFAIDAVPETGLTELSIDHLGFESLGAVAVLAFSTIGLTFYAGLLKRLVAAVEHGHDTPSVGHVLATMPWGRLLMADALLWLATSIASLAFVVPGMVLATFCVLVGPAITLQGATVPEAFRTSFRLIGGTHAFWLALGLVTVPQAIGNEVASAVKDLVPAEQVALVYVTHYAFGLVLGVVLGLIEVSLATALLHNAGDGATGPASTYAQPDPAVEGD